MSNVVWFDSYQRELASRVGGKCASLGELTRAGLPVPPGFAITVDVHATVCAEVEATVARVLAGCDPADAAALAAASAELRSIVEGCPLPADVRDELTTAYAELCRRCGVDDVPVAVRSSATCEDSPDASFAGEHDTFLWVCGAADVLDAVRRCWSSLFTERAIAYRHSMGMATEAIAMSVAVQKMVRPKAAGVAFTLNPHDGDRSQIAIDASWGFGEAVVAGEVTPDNYLVDKVVFDITRRAGVGQGDRVRPRRRRSRACAGPRSRTTGVRSRAWPTRRSSRWPGSPGSPRSTTAARRTPSGRSTSTSRPASGCCCCSPVRRRCGAASRLRSVSAGAASGYASIVSTLVSPLHAKRS